jgi:signal transduction histidine kinase
MMKLLQKTNLYYLIFSAVLLLLAGLSLFIFLTGILKEEVDEKLKVNAERILTLLYSQGEVRSIPPIIEVFPLEGSHFEGSFFIDTLIYDPIEQEKELFREYTTRSMINGKSYQITIRQVKLESHDLYGSIAMVLLVAMGLLLLGLYTTNRYIASRLWHSFFQNLQIIKNFSLQSEGNIQFRSSSIHEFKELNETLIGLTKKLRTDYQALKKFTENAAHELQTPLAIIQSQLETIMQHKMLDQVEADAVEKAYSAVKRLSRLHHNLTLLAGIENKQYERIEKINVSEMLKKVLGAHHDLAASNDTKFQSDIGEGIMVQASPFLTETLLHNLLSNAIRHNIEDGMIRVTLDKSGLTMANTGTELPWPSDKMFERFVTGNPDQGSMGLGLSIVDSICQANNWKISYMWQSPWHHLKVEW